MTTNPDGAPERVYLPLEVANAMSADAPPDKGDILYVRADLRPTVDAGCEWEFKEAVGFDRARYLTTCGMAINASETPIPEFMKFCMFCGGLIK